MHKKRKTSAKIGILFIISILALTSTSVGYALWSETITINGTVNTTELDWEFYNWWNPSGYPSFQTCDQGIDPDWDKDVASTTGAFFDTDNDLDYDQMVVTIDNAYPGYHNEISFWVHCNGQLPLITWKVDFIVGGQVVATLTASTSSTPVYLDISGPNGVPDGQADLLIVWGGNLGQGMQYCNYLGMKFGIAVLQPAPELATMPFTMNLVAVQYNEYPPQ